MFRPQCVFAIAVTVAFSGCAGPRPLTINCDPGGTVLIDGVPTGQTPLNHTFDFAGKASYQVEVKKPGFYDTRLVLHEEHPGLDEGVIQLALMEDESWNATAESRATNTWLRMEVDKSLDAKRVWQTVIDALTTRYSSLEQLDATSGYVRTSPEVRTFSHPKDGEVDIRTQVVCAIASSDPLTYKFKIVAERSTSGRTRWVPYERVFKADATMIEELSNRLGVH